MTAPTVTQQPVAWMYERNGCRSYRDERAPAYTSPAMGFTETALYTRAQTVAEVVAWLRTAEALAGPGPWKSLEVPIRLDVIRNLIEALESGEWSAS